VRPKLWLVAGPNGAGKTTIVQATPIQRVLPGVRIWNPDVLARELLESRGFPGFPSAALDEQRAAFFEAAEMVASLLDDCVSRSVPVGVETVLSTDKYKPLVERVLAAGGFVGLIYVFLRSPELACERVAQRVLEGGHDVPEDKIRSRWSRSLANLAWFAARASRFFVFDNSDSHPNNRPLLIDYGAHGTLLKLSNEASPRITQVLAQFPHGPAVGKTPS
jgi:predicted ABC-type ATPase